MSNTFDKTLREVRGGLVMEELSQKLGELVAAVRATGKGGKLTLELKLKPASKGESVCVMMEDEVTVKLPRLDKATSVFYATEGNVLQRADPRQKEFELREVPQEKPAEPVNVAAMAG